MAKHKAEVPLTLGDKDYVLKYDFNDIADADELAGKSVLSALGSANFSVLRILFYVGARPSEHFKSVQQAGKCIAPNEIAKVTEAVGEALKYALGEGEEGEA